MAERIPPYNEEAEKYVLGAAMQDKDALLDVLEKLKKDDFYSEGHKEIFDTIVSMNENRKTIEPFTVCEELKKRGTLKMVGDRAYVLSLSAEVPSISNAGEYAKIVAENSTLRNLIKISEETTEKCYEAKEDTTALLDNAEQKIFEIAQGRQTKDYASINEVMKRNIDIISELAKKEGALVGVPTGFKGIDSLTSGLQKSELVIIAARPAMGKTAFALNLALQSAIKHNSSVIIFSLEMSKEQLGQRLLSVESRVELKKIKEAQLGEKEWGHITWALDHFNNAKIHIDDTPGISINEIKNKCRRLKEEQGLDLIVIDYLQLMSTSYPAESRTQEISILSRNLKQLAREMDCPVIVLSQLTRGPEQRTDHRPMLSDLRESGSIEQDADIVMFLYRDDYYNEDSDKKGICEVHVAKNRSGATGQVDLTWVEKYTKFSDKG